jgi:hypothetical protein
MPSIATVVADLAAGSVIGLGALPGNNIAIGRDVALSLSHAIKYRYANMEATISASNRLTCTVAKSVNINGVYLYFEDNWATITKMDGLRPLVVSDKFSGCAFKVYRGGGAFVAAHIARPSGSSADANVTLMDDYARQKGWTEVQHVPSTGVVGSHGATTVAIVSQLLGNQLDTVRLGLNGMGVAVARARFTVPV